VFFCQPDYVFTLAGTNLAWLNASDLGAANAFGIALS
jgi:hypothetical protein